ncbi:MAG: hypothetical protein ACPG5Z_00280 [Pseudoalteromonas sp.]
MTKKLMTWEEWHVSEGFEEMRMDTNDMVNVSVCKDAFHANQEPYEAIIKEKDAEINKLKGALENTLNELATWAHKDQVNDIDSQELAEYVDEKRTTLKAKIWTQNDKGLRTYDGVTADYEKTIEDLKSDYKTWICTACGETEFQLKVVQQDEIIDQLKTKLSTCGKEAIRRGNYCNELMGKVAMLCEALEFYADTNNWSDIYDTANYRSCIHREDIQGFIEKAGKFGGRKARTTLEKHKEKL